MIVLLTGAPGAGKTTVLTALSDLLAERDVRHRAIDLDALSWTHPPSEVPPAALAALLEGHDLVHVAAAEPVDVGDETLLVELTAPPESLRERLDAREPAGWPGLDALIAKAESYDPVPDAALTFATDALSPEAMAARVLQILQGREPERVRDAAILRGCRPPGPRLER